MDDIGPPVGGAPDGHRAPPSVQRTLRVESSPWVDHQYQPAHSSIWRHCCGHTALYQACYNHKTCAVWPSRALESASQRYFSLSKIIFLCNYFGTLRIQKYLLEVREMVDIPTQSSNRLQWHQLTIVSPIFYLLVFLRGLDVWLDSFWCLNWLKMLSSNQISKTQTSKLSLLFRRGWNSKYIENQNTL